MTFPDGTVQRVVGHAHGSRQTQREILNLLQDPSISDQSIRSSVMPMTTRLFESVNQFKDDISYLREEVLNAEEPPVHLWVESSETFREGHTTNLRSAWQRRENIRHGLTDSFIAAAGSPLIYLDLMGELNTHTIEGIEDFTPEIIRLWDMSDRLKEGTLSSSQMEARDPRTLQFAMNYIGEWDEFLSLAKTEELYNFDLTRIDNALQATDFSDRVKHSLASRLRAYYYDHVSSLKRDEVNARMMVDKNVSGILFTGLLHLQPTMYLLQQSCLSEMSPNNAVDSAVGASRAIQ